MAGAGYKLFATGDVLTASDVNTYLMQQTVMVFADAAARTTALSGVVAEGMLSYLKDTNAVEVYDGANWVASDDPNAIQNTIVDAKGDLITATGADVPARLAVGNSGDTLVADSATATGLAYIPTFFAGKNKIINGAFDNWQRGTSISLTSNVNTYAADRFVAVCTYSAGSSTVTRQTFTPGAAPVSGYEAQYFSRLTCGTTTTVWGYRQRLEDVRTFAGQTVTLSFWIKASAANATTAIQFAQVFGSGGSSTVTVDLTGPSITTSWQRFTVTAAIPSVSGKTIGTSSYLEVTAYSTTGIATSLEVDTWGWQVEQGSSATSFQTATGTLQGELAACQRYYYRFVSASNYTYFGNGYSSTTTQAKFIVKLPITMRTSPSFSATSAGNLQINGSAASPSVTSVTLDQANPDCVGLFANCSSGLTTGQGVLVIGNNSSAPLFEFTSEL